MKCLNCDGELHPILKDGQSFYQCDKCGRLFTRHDLKYHTPTPQPQTQPQSHQSAPPQPEPNGDDKGKRYNIGRVAAVIGWTLCVLFLIFGLATGGVSLIIFLIAALLINPIFRNHVYISGKIWVPLVIVLFIAGMATAPTTDAEPKKVAEKQEAPAVSVKKQTKESAEKQTKKASEVKKTAKEKAKKEKQERAAWEQAEREEQERIARGQAEQERVAQGQAVAQTEQERIAQEEATAKAEQERIAQERIAQEQAVDQKAEEERVAREQVFNSLDELQQLYTQINPTLSYTEVIEIITASGLPYSEEKYNGSRVVQVSFTEAGTAQKYNNSEEDYLEISYVYPKNENSINDQIEKYTFAECSYIQDAGFTLNFTPNQYYFSDLGNKITKDGIANQLDQLEYYLNNK